MLSEPERAREFAKTYVALVEALQQQGVPQEVARSEARASALIQDAAVASLHYDPAKGPCPLCGNG